MPVVPFLFYLFWNTAIQSYLYLSSLFPLLVFPFHQIIVWYASPWFLSVSESASYFCIYSGGNHLSMTVAIWGVCGWWHCFGSYDKSLELSSSNMKMAAVAPGEAIHYLLSSHSAERVFSLATLTTCLHLQFHHDVPMCRFLCIRWL